MYISNVKIKNFRNLEDISVSTEKVSVLIGDNNSGKTNFLHAISLPLLADEISSVRKNLYWTDINNNAKHRYFEYIKDNKQDFLDDNINNESFANIVPSVEVNLEFYYMDDEYYLIKDLLSEVKENGENKVEIQYTYFCNNIEKLKDQIKTVLNTSRVRDTLKLKQNLLPINLFEYSIIVPVREKKISYDTLSKLTYNFISTDRDDFSSTNSRLGSKNLVKLLNNKLSSDDKITIESQYIKFFEEIKSLANMEEVLNWQDYSEIENASDFFDKINILPNMPAMNSLLSSVKLGYEDDSLSSQGLGYRNLILITVMINSLLKNEENYYSMLSVEEPEAHLSYENQLILISFLKAISDNEESVQVFYSTHSVNFINKLDLSNILLFNEGTVISLKDSLNEEQREYISLNPNLDLLKIFYSERCILVEGLTEELFIKTFLNNLENKLHNVDVISFHKGYRDIMDIWIKLNENTNKKLGIIRDFDDQPNARDEHHEYNDYDNICVRTTEKYTLEDEIVNTGNNFTILNKYFSENSSSNLFSTSSELSEFWRKKKSSAMIELCKNIKDGKLEGFKLPQHIKSVLDFMEVDIGEINGN